MRERTVPNVTRTILSLFVALVALGAWSPAGIAQAARPKLVVKFSTSDRTVVAVGSIQQPDSRKNAASKLQLEEKVTSPHGKSEWLSRKPIQLSTRAKQRKKFTLAWTAPITKQSATMRIRASTGKRTLAVGRTVTVRFKSPTTPPDKPGLQSTVISNGGITTVGIEGITVTAPAGAIAAGQSLTIAPGVNGDLPDPAAPRIAGTFKISTSQGEPSAPVTVSLSYDASQLANGETPVVIHGMSELDAWIPEQTSTAASTATAQIDSFSLLSVVGNWSMALAQGVTWLAGNLTGNRGSNAKGCASAGTIPNWIENVYTPNGINDSLPTCIGSESTSQTAYLHVSNNRGYLQTVEVMNARLNVTKSSWSDSLEAQIGERMATLGTGSSSSFLLAPGSSAVLAFDRSAIQGEDDVTVKVQSAPNGSSAAGTIGWSLLKQATGSLNKVGLGLPVDTFNCVVGVLYQTVQGDAGAASISRIKACVDAATGLSGLARSVLAKISAATVVTDFFYKLVDVESDEAYPPSAEFSVSGTPADPWQPTDPGNSDFLVAKDVSTADRSSCAIRPSGQAVCWGNNQDGELGNGTLDDSSTPTPVQGLSDAKSISSGYINSCAIRTSGQVVCWGYNGDGELGDGSRVSSSVPVNVQGLSDAKTISVGNRFSCAIKESEQAVCWGANNLGQLGDLGQTAQDIPVNVVGLDNARTISAGVMSACGIRWGGQVACWGYGQTVIIPDGPPNYPPSVPGLPDARSISVGWNHACAVRISSQVVCWGQNFDSALGDGTTTDSSTPVSVPGLSSPKFVVASGGDAGGFASARSCALLASGSVSCWGRSDFDAYTDPTIDLTPMPKQGLSDVKVLSVGNSPGGSWHGCAIATSGIVSCWGQGDYGELGNGTDRDSLDPTPVLYGN